MIRFIILFQLFSITAFGTEDYRSLADNYFIMGDHITPAKAELNLIGDLTTDGRLIFHYHHKAIWDVNHRSSPVLDSNYNPQFVYDLKNHYGVRWYLGILEHLSNGNTGGNSRGVNMSYIQAKKSFVFGTSELLMSLKSFVTYKIDNGSPDIQEYMGIWSLRARLQNFISFIRRKHFVSMSINPGGKAGVDWDKGNFSSDFGLKPFDKVNLSLFIQYFKGRNEYLLNYKVKTEALRFGLKLDI